MKKVALLLVFLIVVLGGIYLYFQTPSIPLASDYKNATYSVEGQIVTLMNGLSEVGDMPDSASKTITRYFGNEKEGDLNGDGASDVAFIVTQNTGGSGTFYYVAVALKAEDGYKGLNAVFLGDRIAPQTTEIRDGVVIVNYATRKNDEPMTTSPSVGVSMYLRVVNDTLVEDNVRLGFIRGVSPDLLSISFDEAKWLTGKSGEDAAIKAGLCTEDTRSECLPNDFFIENSSTSTVAFPLDSNIQLFMRTWPTMEAGMPEHPISIKDFAVLISDTKAHWGGLPYNVTIKDNKIIRIEEVYVP